MQSGSYFQCVQCHGDLQEAVSGALECVVCGTSYPKIKNIRLLVDHPVDLLSAHAAWVLNAREEIVRRSGELTATCGEESPSRAALACLDAAYRGQLANLEIIAESITPMTEYLDSHSEEPSFFGDLFNAGLPANDLFKYFYRDWSETEEARVTTALFAGAIKEYCQAGAGAAVVLGCCACGLLYHIANLFPVAFGVEFSVSTLLLADRLLSGEEISVYLNLPSDEFPEVQSCARLRGPMERRSGIKLIAANANQLPFRSSSLSCVMTQFLLDIMPNQQAFAAEIHRVLAPQGIWINFGNPGCVRRRDQFTHLDLPLFCKNAGFDLLDLSMHRYRHLDLSEISEWAAAPVHPAIFFVARKGPNRNDERADPFVEYFAGRGDSVRAKVPQLAVSVAVGHEKLFDSRGIKKRNSITVQHSKKFAASGVTDETAEFADWFLGQIDGSRSIGEIGTLLRARYGNMIADHEVIAFFRQLREDAIVTFM